MKIGYNFNNRLTIQEVSEIPNFECIEITPEIEEILQTMYIPLLVNGVVIESASEQFLASEILREETERYRKRQCDGVTAYAEISAEFRLAKLSGVLTEEQHGAIESILIPVRNEVLAGQWISAKQKLEEIGIVIGSELYNRLHTQISNYINENY